MLIHPQFDPVAVQLGPVAVHWYGIMYLVGFALFLILGCRRAEDAWRGMTKADLEDLLFTGCSAWCWAGAWGFASFISRPGLLRIPWTSLRSGRAA